MKDADPLQGLNLSRREALAREPSRRDLRRAGVAEDLVREYLRRATTVRKGSVTRDERLT